MNCDHYSGLVAACPTVRWEDQVWITPCVVVFIMTATEGQEMSTDQRPVMLCSPEVNAGWFIPYITWINVFVYRYKLCDPVNTCHSKRFSGKADSVKRVYVCVCVQTQYTYIHTYTRLMALFPGLPRWAGTRKVKPIWISLKQETVSGSDISWAICKSAPHSRQMTMPAPHHSVFYRPDALPAAQPTASKHWRHEHWNLRHYTNVLFALLTFTYFGHKRNSTITCVHAVFSMTNVAGCKLFAQSRGVVCQQ